MPTPKDEILMAQNWEDVVGKKLREELERSKQKGEKTEAKQEQSQSNNPEYESSAEVAESCPIDNNNADSSTCPMESKTEICSVVSRFYDMFYSNLFETKPETRAVFRNSMHVQSKALVNIVGAIRHILHSEDATVSIGSLAYRHIKYGVKLEFFDSLGLALVKTLRTMSPESWSDEVHNAWHTVVSYIIYLLVPSYMRGTKSKEHQHLTQTTSAPTSRVGRRPSKIAIGATPQPHRKQVRPPGHTQPPSSERE
jgi:hemoglobin-like flavoprotein